MFKNNAAKFFLTGLCFIALTSATFAQGADESNSQTTGINDLLIQPIRLPSLSEVGGSPFMTNDYQLATVEIADKREVKNIPVKFNIFNNAMMVLKDGQDMKLELFETVTYTDGSNHKVIFKQGYPQIDNHNDKTVYQVLSMGPNLHLLKFMTQKVEEAATLGDYSRREIVTSQQFYVYTPGGEIKKINPSKKSLVEALPSFSARIEEVIKSKEINLKNESGLTTLVEALNKP